MKKILILAILVAIMVQANAQIVSSRSSMITRHVVTQKQKKTKKPKSHNGWKTLGIEYISGCVSHAVDFDANTFGGGAVNYTRAISITRPVPLFWEFGIGGQFLHFNNSSLKYVSVKVPVNLIYDIQIPNTKISLDPYVGLNLRGNVWGECASSSIFSGGVSVYTEGYQYQDYTWTRFQIAAQAGMKARFSNKFFVGIGYGLDFNEVVEDTKVSELSISAGIVF